MKNERQDPPVKPEKEIPVKPDLVPNPKKPHPGEHEPEKNDPTRIEEPQKLDPTRIDQPPLPKPERKQERKIFIEVPAFF